MNTWGINKSEIDYKLLNRISVIMLFLFIYTPKFLFFPVNLSYVVIVLAFGYLCYGTNLGRLLVIFQHKTFLTYLIFFLSCVLYILLIPLIADSEFDKTFLLTYIRLLLDIVLVLPVFVLVFGFDLEYCTDDFLDLLVKVGVAQAIMATLMFLVPDLKEMVFNFFIELPSEKLETQAYRGFGISNDYYFSAPLFQGLVFVLNSILFIKTSKKKYLLYYPFILISLIINARISILVIPIFFGVIFLLSFYYDDLKWLQKLSGLFLIFIAFLGFIGVYFLMNPEKMESLIWIVEGVMGGIGAMSGNLMESKTLSIMFREHIHLPSRWSQIWFGEGMVVFDNPHSSVRSDLGYIRYIYFGGIALSVLAYFTLINFSLNRIVNVKDSLFKATILTLLVTFFVVQMKGDILNSSAFLKGYLLLLIFSLFNHRTKTFDAE
ncbi:hypothetical protein LZF95_11475 [Algoriphagus sp. AGSA1]|uniref:hypothetical protein n=1 Tax=Algoriphagus sp. AGSA1 TaxID=2907213 RepID=UPI001F18B788|nr:hypothetical protein [Algoriphagus sp. AGSA1]MCE7055297.1 hypothetical protein [Algoriphagus sp. AGSA1]